MARQAKVIPVKLSMQNVWNHDMAAACRCQPNLSGAKVGELVRIGKSAEEARMKIVLATTIVHIISSLLADHQLILYFRLPVIKTPPTWPI